MRIFFGKLKYMVQYIISVSYGYNITYMYTTYVFCTIVPIVCMYELNEVASKTYFLN